MLFGSLKITGVVIALLIFALFFLANNSSNVLGTETASTAGDMVLEGSLINGTEGCMVTNNLNRGEKLVWRIKATDEQTGEAIEDAQLKVVLADGKELPMKLKDERDSSDDAEALYWVTAMDIPYDAKTGQWSYEVIATDSAGRENRLKADRQGINALIINAAELPMDIELLGDNGNPLEVAKTGEKITIQARAYYPPSDKNQNDKSAMKQVTTGEVKAFISQKNHYDIISESFLDSPQSVLLDFDEQKQIWQGSWVVPEDQLGSMVVQVLLQDKVPDPNLAMKVVPFMVED